MTTPLDRKIAASQNKLDRLRGRLDSIQQEIYSEAIRYGRLLEQAHPATKTP